MTSAITRLAFCGAGCRNSWAQLAVACGMLLNAAAAETLPGTRRQLTRSAEPDWPQWQGPRRDGISEETGLLQAWPEVPELLWKAEGLGFGYSAPILVRDRLYLTGDVGDDLVLFALDLQGRVMWRAKNGAGWRTPYPGARASCTVSENRVYHMNAHGRVACYDALSGRELWGFNVFERFGGKNITWAISENLLIDGPRLIVTPGGSKALMAALDKKSGETVWQSEPLRLKSPANAGQLGTDEANPGFDSCGYGSPILMESNGRRWIVGTSLRHVFGVDAETGKLLWTHPFPTRYSVIAATPALVGEDIFVTAPDTPRGGQLLRILETNNTARIETVWHTPLDTCHGSVVYVAGTLYGSWYRKAKGWAAIDAATGAVRYQRNDLDQGSVLWADGRLYCLTQDGEMLLVKPEANGFEIAGRFPLTSEKKDDAWAHPVIVNKRLYLRYHETLYCYDVSRSAK